MAEESPEVWTKPVIAVTVILVLVTVAGAEGASMKEYINSLFASIAIPILLVGALRVGYLKLRGGLRRVRAS